MQDPLPCGLRANPSGPPSYRPGRWPHGTVPTFAGSLPLAGVLPALRDVPGNLGRLRRLGSTQGGAWPRQGDDAPTTRDATGTRRVRFGAGARRRCAPGCRTRRGRSPRRVRRRHRHAARVHRTGQDRSRRRGRGHDGRRRGRAGAGRRRWSPARWRRGVRLPDGRLPRAGIGARLSCLHGRPAQRGATGRDATDVDDAGSGPGSPAARIMPLESPASGSCPGTAAAGRRPP